MSDEPASMDPALSAALGAAVVATLNELRALMRARQADRDHVRRLQELQLENARETQQAWDRLDAVAAAYTESLGELPLSARPPSSGSETEA